MLIFISIVVVLGVVVYFWFTKSSVKPVPQVDVTPAPTFDEEAFKQSQLDALAQAKKAREEADALIAKSNATLAQADAALAKSATVASEGETKPKKRRRYYKPKAKK